MTVTTSESPWIDAWLAIGRRNPWIGRAVDPVFDRGCIHLCASFDELKEKLSRDGWCLGQGFALGEICFIDQVDGGDEWLVIRRDLAFESASAALMIRNGRFDAFWADIQAATDEQLRNLTYGRAAA